MDPPPGRRHAAVDWVEEFLKLARRLSPTTVQAYPRNFDRYVLPRFGGYRIGRLPADEIENWLNDERGRHRAVGAEAEEFCPPRLALW